MIEIANLIRCEGQHMIIEFQAIEHCTQWENMNNDSIATSYKLLDEQIYGESSYFASSRNFKALSKAWNTSKMFVQILEHGPKDSAGRESDIKKDLKVASVSSGTTIIVTDEAFTRTSSINTHAWNIFCSVHFAFLLSDQDGARSGIHSVQYLQTSSPSLKLDNQNFDRFKFTTYENISIVTGMCTFSQNLLDTSLSNPNTCRVDATVLLRSPATVHELDFIARCSPAIADIAMSIILQSRINPVMPVPSITLDIPSWHYYPSLLQAWQEGRCDVAEALRWMKAVDQRHDQIASIFTQAIRHELKKRGAWQNEYELGVSAKLNPIATMIRLGLYIGRVPTVTECLAAMSHSGDPHWGTFFSLIPGRELPNTLEDLAYLFYVYAAIKTGIGVQTSKLPVTLSQNEPLHTRTTQKGKRRNLTTCRLILSVDDPVERRIYSRAQESLRKLRGSRSDLSNTVLVETYVCRRIFVNGNRSQARVYRHEATPEPMKLLVVPGYSECSVKYEMIRPFDVVSRLYGEDCAHNLLKWSQKAGLSVWTAI